MFKTKFSVNVECLNEVVVWKAKKKKYTKNIEKNWKRIRSTKMHYDP